MPKQKPNKEKRARMRAEKADAFNSAFSYGYRMGYQQGVKDAALINPNEKDLLGRDYNDQTNLISGNQK